jgi:hypothetical protein
MTEYLHNTKYCNCEHKIIIQKAYDLAKGDENPRNRAQEVFTYVRDQIPFAIFTHERASDTLKRGTGQCITKTGLQIALLRALKIPARYHFVDVHKNTLKGLISDELFDAYGEVITDHPWCECYLENDWVSCETLFDEPLYKAAIQKGIISSRDIPSIEWDGKRDLVLLSKWILKDKGTQPSADKLIDLDIGGMSTMEKLFIASNNYTSRIRSEPR